MSRFTRTDLRPTGYKSEDGNLGLVLNGGEPAPLRGDGDLHLELVQWFKIVPADGRRGPYKTSTTAYFYGIYKGDPPKEVVSYHWHPSQRTAITIPHIHVKGAPFVSRMHVPSGRVAIEHVLFLAHEMGAQPLASDWRRVLLESLGRFERWRTWPS